MLPRNRPLNTTRAHTDPVTNLPGREGELTRIESACGEALAGAGRLALITGEAGIGKSRLAQAAIEHASTLGMASARGWCIADAGAPVLWPWRRAARDLPGLATALGAAADLDVDDGARFRLTDAVACALAAVAVGSGLLIVLEDLHWADSASLDLLRGVLPEINTARVLLVATAREDGLVGTPFGRVLPELLRAPDTVHLPLSGLTPEAVARWLAGDERTSTWVPHADDLVRRTSGNPFYIRSLTTTLAPRSGVDASVAFVERPAWRAVLVAAYQALPGPARRTVATAAVLGERLSPAMLASALGWPVRDVSDHLASAVASGILNFGDTGLAFNHALVRDAIIADLDPADRVQAHAIVAAALEDTRDPLLAGLAAVHWSQVPGPDAAQRCRDVAARAATEQVLAPDRGVELARLAFQSARALGAADEELAERLLVVTRFQWGAGMLKAALESCATGHDLAERAGRPDIMADFALVPQGIGSSDVAQVAGEMCRRALAVLPEAETTRRARLLALCAVSAAEAAQSLPRGEVAEQFSPNVLSTEALTAARASHDRHAELEAIAARHFVLSYPQAISERSELAARAVTLGTTAATTMGALWGHLWEADLAFQRGDLFGVQQAIAEVDRVAEGRSSPVARWHARRLQSAVRILTGNFGEARDAAREARTNADRIGDVSMIGMHYAFQTQLGYVRGDPAEFPPELMDVLEGAPAIPLVRAAIPLIYGVRGDLERATAEFAPMRDVPARMPLGPRWAGTVGQIALGAVVVADVSVARECYQLLLPCAQWCAGDGGGAPFASGSNERPLGMLAQTFGDLPLAAAHFERAIAVDDRIGATPYAALGRLGLAECLEVADPVRAHALARDAADELARLDMPGPLGKAVALCERLDAVGGPSDRPGGLTERELEVAQLVGQTLTNRQIAERLVLSVRTVESHVRSTLAKLGLSTRIEIALWVRDRR